MSRNWWLISIAGVLCFASGCNSKTASTPNSSPAETATPPETAADSIQTEPLAAKDFFPDPLVSASTDIQAVPVPNLIPPTSSVERVPQVDTGRADPFASLNLSPTVVRVKEAPKATTPTVTVAATQPQNPTVLPLPPLMPSPTALTPLPTVNVPPPAPPPRPLSETIEISGVVEVAGKTNVIIKSPDEYTSRYAAVGERLGNGQVLIKRVEMGLEPVVILEQDGREVVRSIGASSALVGAM